MLRAQGRESALPRQPAQQVQRRDNLETIRHLQKGGGCGEVTSVCEQPWPIFTPVFLNIATGVLKIKKEQTART